MLTFTESDTLEGIEVYGDDEREGTYYLLPNEPSFARNEDGTPKFSYFKYRSLKENEDGSVGGGYCLLSTQLAVGEEKREKIRTTLQTRLDKKYENSNREAPEVRFAPISFIDGSVDLILMEDDRFVEQVRSSAKPSLVGKNVGTFSVELTQEGAAAFESGLQGLGSFVGVDYSLQFYAKLPPTEATIFFNSSKFYDYAQTFESRSERDGVFKKLGNWLFGGKSGDREKISTEMRETMRQNEIANVDLSVGPAAPGVSVEQHDQMQAQLRDWAWSTLEDAVANSMAEALPKVGADDREVPKGATDFERIVENRAISSVRRSFTEEQTVVVHKYPNGPLQNFTNLTDAEGNPLKWEDYAKEVDLDDPFFQRLIVDLGVNADFGALPIHSVEVKIEHEGDRRAIDEFLFVSPDERERFTNFTEEGQFEYDYSYQVNYKGESRILEAGPFTTNDKILTVGVDDVGILDVEIVNSDIDFTEVKQAVVTFEYEDSGVDTITRKFVLDSNTDRHHIQEVVFEPVTSSYRYRVDYSMQDGRTYEVDWKEGRSPVVFISDPFGAQKTVSVRATGNLTEEIERIFVDLTYTDEGNDYTTSTSQALSESNPFFDWIFPAIDADAGVVTYTATIQRKDGTVEEIEETEATSDTILVGPTVADRIDIEVIPDLLDASAIKLVKVDLAYSDPANDISERESLIFRGDGLSTQTWTVDLKDKEATEFSWKATFFMADDSRKEVGPKTTSDPTIILEMPQTPA
jgi:hypothetical protein